MSYRYTQSTAEKLKRTQFFPFAAWVHWPGYDTKVIDTNIDGRDITIQMWKGFCFPYVIPGLGGYGAEIGLYKRNWVPGLWWPDYNYKKTMSFSLVNPITNEEFFSAGPENVWWLSKWMTISSYEEYKKTHKVPDAATQYIMKCVINGMEINW